MATRMRWAAAFAGGCALIALLVFTIFDPAEKEIDESMVMSRTLAPNRSHPLVLRMHRLRLEAAAVNEELVHAALVDSARRLLPDTRGVALSLQTPRPARVPFPVELSDSGALVVTEAIEAQLARLGGTSVRLAVVTLPATLGRTDGLPPRTARLVRYQAGTDEKGAYCLVILGAYSGRLEVELVDALLEGGSPLGPCRLWARYGAPGPEVAAWLGSAGHLMDAEEPAPAEPPATRRLLFGFRPFAWDFPHVGPAGESCLAGRVAACEEAFFARSASDPRLDGMSDAGTALHVRSAWRSPLPHRINGMFADLERELGPERFAAFWRSTGPARPVLEDALQADFSEWLMGWARARLGVEPLGPRVRWPTLLLSLLAIGALAGAGVAVGMRRQIG